MSKFVSTQKLASDTFAATVMRLVRFYLMSAILQRASQAEQAREKSGGKSASGRYVPFKGTVDFAYNESTAITVAKKTSRYMAGRFNELRPIQQTREVHLSRGGDYGGLVYSFFVELKDETTGMEVSTMMTCKQVPTFVHPKNRDQVDQDLLDEVAADIFSFLYSQRPEEKALKELRLQRAA